MEWLLVASAAFALGYFVRGLVKGEQDEPSPEAYILTQAEVDALLRAHGI